MVLLVVDAQNGIVDERLYEFRKFVGNIKKLIGAAREQGIEVIYVQHDDGLGTGFSIGDDELRSILSLNRCLMKNDLLSLYAVRSKKRVVCLSI